MQLMWISGPTGKVRKISITARNVVVWGSSLMFGLVAVGVLLYHVGFKIAIEVRPSLALSLGGIATKAEEERMESYYRQRLQAVQTSLDATVQKIRQLQTLKDRFMVLATPVPLREKHDGVGDGRGGPLIPVLTSPPPVASLPASMDDTLKEATQFQKTLDDVQKNWRQQLSWLKTLPTGIPIGGDYGLSSGYGLRNDPLTGTLARHDGLDFSAAFGTPILAAADGVVTRVGHDVSYGNVVEITHAEGFVTRYAHLSRALVVPGQKVTRGQHVADVGSTGRSTGPHLHYEVINKGFVINPAQVLLFSHGLTRQEEESCSGKKSPLLIWPRPRKSSTP